MTMTRALSTIAVLLVAACRREGTPGPVSDTGTVSVQPKRTPAPQFSSFDRAPIDSILAYAASLSFDTDRGVSDSQPLAVLKPGGATCPEGCTYGPIVTIQPEVGSAFLTDDDLKAGRVVGRFVNEDTIPYDKLNISAKSITYFVVVNTGAKEWTGYYVSSDPARGSQSRIPYPIYVDSPHRGRYTRSTARWIWQARDEGAWLTCGTRCCSTDP